MEATSGVLDGLLSLPAGGGSLHGLGDRFQPDMLKGTGNYSVPLSVPKGPNEFAPSLSLHYSTGQGNGPFGLGWRLGGATEIRRRTDRGLPVYDDDFDEFALSGAETLVPVGGGRFRPRTDTRFLDIRRAGDGWAVRTKDGHASGVGTTAEGRLADGPRVFAWVVETETDQAGNEIRYSWLRDENQLYLQQVEWGIWSLRFVYEPRPDVLYNGRAGFGIATALRCTAIERRCDRLARPLLGRYSLVYAEAEGSRLSLLTEVHLTGIGEDGAEEEAPVLKLGYTAHTAGSERYLRAKARRRRRDCTSAARRLSTWTATAYRTCCTPIWVGPPLAEPRRRLVRERPAAAARRAGPSTKWRIDCWAATTSRTSEEFFLNFQSMYQRLRRRAESVERLLPDKPDDVRGRHDPGVGPRSTRRSTSESS